MNKNKKDNLIKNIKKFATYKIERRENAKKILGRIIVVIILFVAFVRLAING